MKVRYAILSDYYDSRNYITPSKYYFIEKWYRDNTFVIKDDEGKSITCDIRGDHHTYEAPWEVQVMTCATKDNVVELPKNFNWRSA